MTTRIGLIGNDIATSLSPALHANEASTHGIVDYRYELIDLPSDADAGAALLNAVADGYVGFNITHPFKQAVLTTLDGISDEAAALGAVNTVVVDDGKLLGHNTDYTGFRTALTTGLTGVALGRVTLVGAGGAGSAVAFALAHSGVRHLTIADVDAARAAALAERVSTAGSQPAGATASVDSIALADLAASLKHSDGLVNATPVGMVGHPGTPVSADLIRPSHWVADIIYRPLYTELICHAEQLGCRVLDGGQMLVAQAAASFDLLTGRHADLDRMRTHLEQLVSARTVAA